MEPRLRRQLERVDERLRQVRRNTSSAVVWAFFALLSFVAFAARDTIATSVVPVALALVAIALLAVFGVRRVVYRRPRDARSVARFVEARHPELGTSLLAATEQTPDLPDGRYGFLAKRLIDEVMQQAHRHPWVHLVPESRLHGSRVLHAGAAAAFGCLAALLAGSPFVPALAPRSDRTSDAVDLAVVVVPGDAEIERGRGVLVSAEFAPDRVPGGAELVLSFPDAEERRSMARSLDDPILAARIGSVREDLTYRVEWSGGSTRSYRLSVFDHPELARADVHLRYPDYTGKADELVEDTRRITAPEGTQIELLCRLNKPVERAELVDELDGTTIALHADGEDPLLVRTSLLLEESRRLELFLEDEAGRGNQERVVFVVKVTTNQRPEILAAVRDVRVSALEELTLSARLSDDFGVRRYGLGYSLGGEEPVETVLGEAEVEEPEVQVEHTIALEELGARPGQLVSFHFWAEDRDVAGRARRATSDLYFAEVRPFEEIFREGQAPAGGSQGGGGGGGGQAPPEGDLAEQQRDVLLATWNVMQSGVDDEGSLVEAVEVIRDGQRDVRQRLREMASRAAMAGAGDADLDALVSAADGHMDTALRSLERALGEAAVQPLREAVAPEQAAYEKLLELRATEFDVVQGDRQSGGGGGGGRQSGPSQAQLEELQLSSSENRYENRSQAQPEQDASAETRQALSRLKELARRQRDLNDRLRELQSELAAAETEEEREEIERRLKRLQEAQEEILRDTDELRQRMQEATERQRLAEESQRLEETRENVRQASEALEEGRLSQALTEGSRARQQLSELEQELRDASSGQFDQRLRDLQQDARRLEEEQERIGQKLSAENEERARSLSDSTDREGLQQELERQEEDLARLLESLENTMQEAEETEPLLAEELYETLNETRENRLEEALEVTRELIERGFPGEAEDPERIAREGLGRLRQGVEGAAESVLGTGVEALERARDELQQLSQELEDEVARAQEGREGGSQREAAGGRRAGDPRGPLTGEDFLRWSDRLRDVEEILDDADLSAEAARLRSRARSVREEYKRHSKEPNWSLVEVEIAGPLGELGRLVTEELRRRKADDSLVPIDRDPVPPEYEEAVRRYYESLGRSR